MASLRSRSRRAQRIMLLVFAIFLVPLIARLLNAVGNGPRCWRDAD